MSKKANPTAVGAFVLGALTLTFVLLIVLGGGMFKERSERFVLFFEGSVDGLRVGAPVKFRGVPVGTVADIGFSLGETRELINIPVYIEFDRNSISGSGMDGTVRSMTTREFMNVLVERGVRAQLQMQSFVTGQLQIQLDFFPEETPRLTGLDPAVPELPTVPSPLEAISQKLEELPINDIIDQVARITAGIDSIINSQKTQEAVQGLTDSMVELRELVKQVGDEIPDFMEILEQTVANTNELVKTADAGLKELTPVTKQTLEQIRKTAAMEEGRPGEIANEIEALVKTTDATLKEAEELMAALREPAEPDSVMRHQISVLIQELSDASRAVRAAADYLNRHPESVLRGKGRDR